MLHNEIRNKFYAYKHANKGLTPNTLLISNNIYEQLVMTAPVSAIGRSRDGAKTYNGMRILIIQNTIDLLQVVKLDD